MNGPRYWWQEPEDGEGDIALVPADAVPPPAARPARRSIEADTAQLKVYRQALTRKALLLPHGGARRREVEKQLARITADLLRLELKGRQ